MTEVKYFVSPTQVMFLEDAELVDDPQWTLGIAYQDYVICSCCGATLAIEDLAQIKEIPNWLDFSSLVPNIDLLED